MVFLITVPTRFSTVWLSLLLVVLIQLIDIGLVLQFKYSTISPFSALYYMMYSDVERIIYGAHGAFPVQKKGEKWICFFRGREVDMWWQRLGICVPSGAPILTSG